MKISLLGSKRHRAETFTEAVAEVAIFLEEGADLGGVQFGIGGHGFVGLAFELGDAGVGEDADESVGCVEVLGTGRAGLEEDGHGEMLEGIQVKAIAGQRAEIGEGRGGVGDDGGAREGLRGARRARRRGRAGHRGKRCS